MPIKVKQEKINRLNQQVVKENKTVNAVDAVDRSFGKIFSKIGKYFDPKEGEFWK